MEYRLLGRTDLRVSEIGYGAWGIGAAHWVGAQEDESVRALHRAIELGVNFIDTARGYGESERIVGRRASSITRATTSTWRRRCRRRTASFRRRRASIRPTRSPGTHIRASLEESLRASGLEAFDVFQFHVWSDEWIGRGDWLETINALKQEGKIRFFGVSINDHEPESALELISSGEVDTVQVIYNAFHQQPEELLLPACLQADVGVIVRVALDEGGLTGTITADTTFPDGDFRQSYFGGDRPAQVEQHVRALRADSGHRVRPGRRHGTALRARPSCGLDRDRRDADRP